MKQMPQIKAKDGLINTSDEYLRKLQTTVRAVKKIVAELGALESEINKDIGDLTKMLLLAFAS